MGDVSDERIAQAARAMALLMAAEAAMTKMESFGDFVIGAKNSCNESVELLCSYVRETYEPEECDMIIKISAELFRRSIEQRIKQMPSHQQ